MGYFNPLLKLPAARKILALPDSPEKRLFEQLLRELRSEADELAERSWRARKGPMAAYWRSVATYARHTAHVFSRAATAAHRVLGAALATRTASREKREQEACVS